jgi:hypothetical protein
VRPRRKVCLLRINRLAHWGSCESPRVDAVARNLACAHPRRKRGTGPTGATVGPHAIRCRRTTPASSGQASSPFNGQMRPAPQVLASALRSLTQKVSEPPSLDFETELAPQGDDPQPATTRRTRSASACSLAAKSRARLACSAPAQPATHPGPPCPRARARPPVRPRQPPRPARRPAPRAADSAPATAGRARADQACSRQDRPP